MTVQIKKDGTYVGANNHTEVIRELAAQRAHDLAATETALTNNAGGTAGSTVSKVSVALENEANASTNLASKTTTETALGTVKDGLLELATAANAIATAIGISTITYNGGGTAADGTIGAVTVATTAATTGAQATETNANLVLVNDAVYQVAVLTNKICAACGIDQLSLEADWNGDYDGTVAAITTTVGTAADPGVTKVAMDAVLVECRTNITSIAAKLIAAATAPKAKVLAV